MKHVRTFLAFASAFTAANAGHLKLYGRGPDCPGQCGPGNGIVISSRQTTGCMDFTNYGGPPGGQLSFQSMTNMWPPCKVNFYSGNDCNFKVFTVSTAEKFSCTNGVIRSMNWVCEGGVSSRTSGEMDELPLQNDTTLPDDSEVDLMKLPAVEASFNWTRLMDTNEPINDTSPGERALTKRACGLDQLWDGSLYWGALVQVGSGQWEGNNEVDIDYVEVGGNRGIPGGTLNADARDVASRIRAELLGGNRHDYTFEMRTQHALRVRVTLGTDYTFDLSTFLRRIGHAALGSMLAAALGRLNIQERNRISWGAYITGEDGRRRYIDFKVEVLG